ncbi:MAG: aminopeptidase P family protein [Desulfarculus sp.]|nr:aminopeptidase P family protein [Desulfarculus sp.]
MIKMRLARLRRLLAKQKLDGLLVSQPANRRYLSGFTPADGQLGESCGSLLVTQRDALLLTDFRYMLTAQAQAAYYDVRIYRQGLAQELAGLAGRLGIKRLGIEAEALLLDQHQRLAQALEGVDLVPTRGLVAGLRARKDPEELRQITASLALMERVLDQVLSGDLVGTSERQLALKLMRAVEDQGGEGPAFPPIVASGPNGAEPHAEPGERVIQAGEPVIFDVGALVMGYMSDISRTVVAGGLERADEQFRQVYAVVRQAQLKAIAEIRPGMTGSEADALAREVIAQAGFGERFGHSLGHGVGLYTHEAPSLGPNSRDVLEPGMVFTIEPGIYLPGWGGVRLEQMAVLTATGCRLLNGLDRFHDL